MVYVSGEPHTQGHVYRVERFARSATELGYAVDIISADDLSPKWLDRHAAVPVIVVIWRATWRPALKHAVSAWRSGGARIVFDVDDYMFDPDIARPEIIDGIRSQNLTSKGVADHYQKIRKTLMWSDACTVPTAPLADGIESCGKPAIVAVNGFDEETYRVSREAVLRRRQEQPDGLVRVGYASGSRTHQRDFAIVAPVIADILRSHHNCRLVLFRDETDKQPYLDVREFPALADLNGQVEWRPFVSLARLPEELARFDVNITPLETGNVFCEAKSELKYFEAALVEVPTVASPTQPFRSAIEHGRTGFLAANSEEWRRCLEGLVSDTALRQKVGQAALHNVLHRYGPDGRRERLRNVFDRLSGSADQRTASFQHEIARRHAHPSPLPVVPESDVIRRYGAKRLARVAVVVPLYNYETYIVEALESVLQQTLDSIELVVVDDRSTDSSLRVATEWLDHNTRRFVSATLLQNRHNQGLPLTRNVGFAQADAPFVFPLDADNVLGPQCLELLLGRLLNSACSATHPTLQRFGGCDLHHAAQPWSPDRLRCGNYIDAMALIRKSAWAHVGGYKKGDFIGWEDYEFWCTFVEHGMWSDAVPQAEARYRVHASSMLQTHTNRKMDEVVHAIRTLHPWVTVKAV